MNNIKEREKYKYVIFSIVLSIPVLIFFNLLLPIIGITNFTVFSGLIPAFFVGVILYTSNRSQIYTFNYALFKVYPYIFSLICLTLIVVVCIEIGMVNNTILILTPIVTILLLKVGFLLKRKLFFNDKSSEKDISISLSKFVSLNDKEEIIEIYTNTLKKILNSKSVKLFRYGSDKYDLYVSKLNPSHEKCFEIISNEKEVMVIYLSFGIFFIESESINLIKFKEKLNQINNLSTGFLLTINRIRIIEELEKINMNFENELKLRTKSLRNSYNELQELEEAKDEFIALTSHQLKTPLTVIKGYGDMLRMEYFGKLTNTQFETLAKIQIQIDNLLQISENILSVFKIKSGKFNSKIEKVNLIELIQEIYRGYKDKALIKELEFKLNINDINSLFVSADRYKLKQALSNLIDNAINYTEKGFVSLDLDNTSLKITDSGIGIPDYFKDKIFKQFERADNASLVKPDGTGIGLYLTKKILDQSNMGIKIDSNSGGTAVYIQFNPS